MLIRRDNFHYPIWTPLPLSPGSNWHLQAFWRFVLAYHPSLRDGRSPLTITSSFACKELWSASLSCSGHFCVGKGLGLKDFFSSMCMQSNWSWRLSPELGEKHLEPELWFKNQGTLWHAVPKSGLFARLSCRQWLFWHQNTDLWVLSPSSKSPGTRRCLPLAYLQPQVALHEDFPAPIPWDTLLHVAIGRQTWTEGFWRFLELKQEKSTRLRCCQTLFNFHLGPVPNAPGAGPAFSVT